MIPLRDVIPSRTRPVVTIALIAVNVLVFFHQAGLSPEENEGFIGAYGVVPAFFSWLDVLTSMFVHGGLLHAAGNMLYLWIFGDNVEDRLGHGRFLLFYLLCGAGAAAAQTFAVPDSFIPMVGASGAIAGVMGAYFVLYPKSRVLTLIPFPIMVVELPAVYLLGFWFVMQFVSGLATLAPRPDDAMMGGVAFWAHAAGFGVGALLVLVLRRPERQRVEWWDGSLPGR